MTRIQKLILSSLVCFSFLFFVGGVAQATITIDATSVTGDSTLTLNGAAASNVTIAGATTSGTIAIGALATGNVNLAAGNTAKTINIGSGTAVDTINIGTGGTGIDVITIGDSLASLALTDTQWSITTAGLFTTATDIAVNGDDITADGDLTITGATGANIVATTGTLDLTSSASAVTITATGATAGDITITSGDDTTINPTGILTLTSGEAATWSTTTGDLTLTATAASVNINANEAAADQIKLSAAGTIAGNAINLATTNGGIVMTAGGAANGDITITATNDLTLATTDGNVAITPGAVGNTITIGKSDGTGAIALGSSNGAQAINVGIGGTGAKTITIGDGASTGTTTIKSGSGGTIVQSADDNALTVGANGVTNPVLQINAATGSVATGVKITGAAAAGGVAVAAISSGTDENLTIDAKGAGTITLGGTSTGAIGLSRAVNATVSLAVGSGTAITKIVKGNLADDASGWTPDGAGDVAFTITADAASVGANSYIGVSIGANANAAACSVHTRTASTNFVVKCSAAPADAATLQYIIVN